MKNKIIKLDPNDYEKCNNIWDMSSQPNTGKWYDEIVSGNRCVFVYTIDSDFIGECALVFENGDSDYTIKNRRIYMSRLIVKSDYRRQGIGEKIVDYLIEKAREMGFCEISIGVDADNFSALNLYRKKGFDTVLFQGKDEIGEYYKLLKRL